MLWTDEAASKMLESFKGAHDSYLHQMTTVYHWCNTIYPLQVTAARRTLHAQKQNTVVCQAIAEPQAKPVGEQEMRIASDVSQLIGVSELTCLLGLQSPASSKVCNAQGTLLCAI